jgi:DNA-binding response OmpR family regulator
MYILMVEDEGRLATLVQRRLSEERHTVDVTGDGITGLALALATSSNYDVIILDAQLPGMDGLEISRKIRTAGVTTPVLLCSACDAVDDCVAGFDAGADDFLAKPFALEELLARVHALGRRGWRSGPAATPGPRGVGDGAPDGAVMEGTPPEASEASLRRAQSLAGYLRHAWATCLHRLSPGG